MQLKYLTAVPLLVGVSLAQNSTTTSSSSVPTCSFTGWDTGSNIAYYAGASSATYEACDALCDANTACLSFSYNAAGPDCILYDYVVEGNDVADANSPNTFYDRGGVCPTTTTTTSTSTSTTPTTTATPTCTGFVGYDDGTNIGKYRVPAPDPISAATDVPPRILRRCRVGHVLRLPCAMRCELGVLEFRAHLRARVYPLQLHCGGQRCRLRERREHLLRPWWSLPNDDDFHRHFHFQHRDPDANGCFRQCEYCLVPLPVPPVTRQGRLLTGMV